MPETAVVTTTRSLHPSLTPIGGTSLKRHCSILESKLVKVFKQVQVFKPVKILKPARVFKPVNVFKQVKVNKRIVEINVLIYLTSLRSLFDVIMKFVTLAADTHQSTRRT